MTTVVDRYRLPNGDLANVVTSGRAASTSKSAVTATWSTTSRISRFALLLHVRCEGWEQER